MSQIKKVENATPCPACHRPRVRVTFDGTPTITITVHDDGSFIAWLGESNAG